MGAFAEIWNKVVTFVRETGGPKVFAFGSVLAAVLMLVTFVLFWLLLMEAHRAAKVGVNRVKECGGRAYLEAESAGYQLYTKMVERDYKLRLGRLLEWSVFVFTIVCWSMLLYAVVVADGIKVRWDNKEMAYRWLFIGAGVVWLLMLFYAVQKVFRMGSDGTFSNVYLAALGPAKPTAERKRERAAARAEGAGEEGSVTFEDFKKQATAVVAVCALYFVLVMWLGGPEFHKTQDVSGSGWKAAVVGSGFSGVLFPVALFLATVVFLYGSTVVSATFKRISGYEAKVAAANGPLVKLPDQAIIDSLLPHMATMKTEKVAIDEGGPDLVDEADVRKVLADGKGVYYAIHMDGNEFAAQEATHGADVAALQSAMGDLRAYHGEIAADVAKTTGVFNGLVVAIVFLAGLKALS